MKDKPSHLLVIVEGVETEQQAEYFAAANQPMLAQGWLFGRPAPVEEFCRTLLDRDRKRMAHAETGERDVASVA